MFKKGLTRASFHRLVLAGDSVVVGPGSPGSGSDHTPDTKQRCRKLIEEQQTDIDIRCQNQVVADLHTSRHPIDLVAVLSRVEKLSTLAGRGGGLIHYLFLLYTVHMVCEY
jgi:hypothetical protein